MDKFMQTLDDGIYGELEIIAKERGISNIQQLFRAVIFPEWLGYNGYNVNNGKNQKSASASSYQSEKLKYDSSIDTKQDQRDLVKPHEKSTSSSDGNSTAQQYQSSIMNGNLETLTSNGDSIERNYERKKPNVDYRTKSIPPVSTKNDGPSFNQILIQISEGKPIEEIK